MGRRAPRRFSLVAALSATVAAAEESCRFTLNRSPFSTPFSRIVPVPTRGGVAVVLQEGSSINIQKQSRDCQTTSHERTPVFTSRELSGDASAGLQDAIAINDSSYAVAWTLEGNVWVSVVSEVPDRLSQPPWVRQFSATVPVLASSNATGAQRPREHVRIAAGGTGNNGAFAVSWSSWGQDGDAWGSYAALFHESGDLLAPERQLNEHWRGSQGRPELRWCRNSLWAVWLNGTGISCLGPSPPEDCANGPMLRHLSAAWFMNRSAQQAEWDLRGKRPIAAALACRGDTASVTPLWLEDGGSDVRWKPTDPPQQPFRIGLAGADLEPYMSRPLRRLATAAQFNFLWGFGGRTTGTIPNAGGAVPPGVRGASSSDDGGVVLVAANGLMALVTSDSQRLAAVQLIDYGSRMGPQVFTPKQLGTGQGFRVVWDTTIPSSPMLVACFDTHISHNNEYVCQRLSASWLAGAGEPFNLGLFLTAGMVATAVVFYMLRHCSIPRPARQINAPTVRAQSLRELRTQLEQIPRETRRPQPARESPDACPDEAPSGPTLPPAPAAATPAPVQNDCSICRNEVRVRVALRPCGHTACRDCVVQLVEMNRATQRCHICRAGIDGLQPVYM